MNNKYVIALIQITKTEISISIAVLVFKLLSPRGFFYKQKRLLKSRLFFQISLENYCKFRNRWNVKCSRYFWNTLTFIYQYFFNLDDCPFKGLIIQKLGSISIRYFVRSQRLHCWLIVEKKSSLSTEKWESSWPEKSSWIAQNCYPWMHVMKHNKLLLIKKPIKIRYLTRTERSVSAGAQKH